MMKDVFAVLNRGSGLPVVWGERVEGGPGGEA